MPRRIASESMLFLKESRGTGDGPLAGVLADALRLALSRGRIAAGELIPAERELSAWFKVTPVAVRKALSDLVDSGILDKKPRVGYAVRRAPIEGGKVRRIGLIFHDALGLDGTSGLKEIQQVARRIASAGHALVISGSDLTAEGEDGCVLRLREAGVDGLVVTPAVKGERSQQLERWIREGRPVVLSGHPGQWLLPDELAGQCDQVDVDNESGIRQALQYLFSLGHEDVAMVSGGREPFSERIGAFLKIMEERKPGGGCRLASGMPMGRPGGRRGFEILREQGVPTAIVCTTDDLALGVIDAAREAGLNCPGDLSVCGFNNESMDGPGVISSLTTVDISGEVQAALTWECLENRLNRQPCAASHLRAPVRLVIRESCSIPRHAVVTGQG